MMKKIISIVVKILSLSVLLSATSYRFYATANVDSNVNEYLEITSFFHSYDPEFQLPLTVSENTNIRWEPIKITYGPIQISINEVLYDGYWMFTAANVMSMNESIIIMPGASYPTDFYKNTDDTYLNVAERNNRYLTAVYVYPAYFDQLGSYFLDSIDHGDSGVTCLSGANWISDRKAVDVLWTVEIYSVDLISLKYSLLERIERNSTVCQISEKKEYIYNIASDNNKNIGFMKLIDTGLSSYVEFLGDSIDTANFYSIILEDEEGNAYKRGAPPALNSFIISETPKKILLRLRRTPYSQEESILLNLE